MFPGLIDLHVHFNEPGHTEWEGAATGSRALAAAAERCFSSKQGRAAQSTLAVLLDQGYHHRGLPLERIASLISAEPARRFRTANRRRLVPGARADLVLIDLAAAFTLQPEDLLQRHALSPYIGASFRCVVKRTIRRGETIFAGGKAAVQNGGRLVRPIPL